jgi:hypothetical protein
LCLIAFYPDHPTGSYGAAYLVELRADRSKKYVAKEVMVGHLSIKDREAAQLEAEVLRQVSNRGLNLKMGHKAPG